MEVLEALTKPKRHSLHSWNGDGFVETPWNDVLIGARRAAVGLRHAGVAQGTPVASVLTNSPDVVRGILGIWLAGGAVASLPVPARAMGMDEYAEQLVTLCRHVESPVLLVERRLIEFLREPLAGRVELRAWESLPRDGALEPAPPEADDLAFIQYSSGSTNRPKGCALSARAIGNQLATLAEMVDAVEGEEAVASWLPLSHDMGAFGCLLFSWAHDFTLALSSPERFMYDPRTWFGDCADFGATLSAGPPSALHVAARAHRSGRLSGELRIKACVIGAERIAWPVFGAATAALSPYGLTSKAWMPAYGMAEATLVVSAVGLEDDPSFRYVDNVALANGEIRELDEAEDDAAAIVSAGRPCAATQVEMADPDRLSEILVRSTSLADGYYKQPEETAAQFRDGWLATGDLGFIRGGELYVVGRADDVLSVAGRKVYAREIEATVDLLEEVRSGCSTIVDAGQDDRVRLVMLLELNDAAADCRQLATAASRIAKSKAGVVLDECVFLPKGSLPKTPSGKIQRFRCKHLVASGALDPIARVELGAARRVTRTDIARKAGTAPAEVA